MMPSFLSRKKPHSVYGAVGGSASSTAVAASSSATQIPSSISAPTGFTHVAHVGPSVGPAASSSRLDHPAPTHALAYGQPTAVPYDPVEAQRISAQQVAEMYRAPAQPPAAYGGGPRTDYVTEGYRYSGEHDYGAARARQLSSETRLSGSAQSEARNDYYQPRELDHRSSASSLNSARSNGLSSGQSANRSSSGGTSASTMPPEPLTPPPMLTHGPPHPSYEHTKATPTPAYYSSGESPAMQQTPPAAQHSGVMTPSVSSMGTLTINSPNMSVTSSQRKTSSRYALGDFEFIRTLGTGSFGRVHLVRSRHNTRYYAVKVLSKERVVKMKQVEHTNSEREMLERVRHPMLVNLWGTFKDAHNLYMVMDFVSGGELFSLLRKSQRFPDPVAKFFAAEVALALDYLHSLDIIYRDLKPENILLAADGHIRFADFGFARYCPDVTWTLCGTPDYLAPEIVQSKGYNKSVDWYALGVLVFEMLAGYPPFFSEDSNPMKLYEKIIAAKVRYPSHFGVNAKDLIRNLIASDLTKRFGNLANGSRDIFGHCWFQEVDWERLFRKEIPAPYVPQIDGDGDYRHFDQYAEVDTTVEYGQPGPDPHGHLFALF